LIEKCGKDIKGIFSIRVDGRMIRIGELESDVRFEKIF
jgi:hypothetical protein